MMKILNFNEFVNEGAETDLRTQIEAKEKEILDISQDDPQKDFKKAGLKKIISQIKDQINDMIAKENEAGA